MSRRVDLCMWMLFIWLDASLLGVPDVAVGIYQANGEDARCGAKEVNSMRQEVISATHEQEDRSKEGIVYETNTFQTVFKDQPDVIKKAKFQPVRFRNPHTGQMCTGQRTKVYDLQEGEYRLKK